MSALSEYGTIVNNRTYDVVQGSTAESAFDIATVSFSSITEDPVVGLLVFDFVLGRGKIGLGFEFHDQLSKLGVFGVLRTFTAAARVFMSSTITIWETTYY